MGGGGWGLTAGAVRGAGGGGGGGWGRTAGGVSAPSPPPPPPAAKFASQGDAHVKTDA